MKEAVSERREAFAAAHRSDEDCQAYIFAFCYALFVIAKAEAWQATCSSLSPKFVYFLLTVASSFSSSFLSSRESASVFADYLRFEFSVSQPKALRSRARGYLSELRRVTCPEKFYSSFCSLFSQAELFEAATNLSWSTATGPDKVAYHMPKQSSSLWHKFSPTHF